MATRLYLSTEAAPVTTVTQEAGWDFNTATAPRIKLRADKNTDETPTTHTVTGNTGGANTDILMAQAVSDPLTAGSVFTATTHWVKSQARARESANGANAFAQFSLRVIASDNTTVQATLYPLTTVTTAPGSAAELDTTLTNHRFPLTTNDPPPATGQPLAASYTTVAGDYLVVEYGIRRNTATTSFNFEFSYGIDSAGTLDLPDNITTTGALVPWIEFSNDFTIAGAAAAEGPILMMAPPGARY